MGVDEIPPPPNTGIPPSLPRTNGWFYAGPIVVDVLAMICTTVLCATGQLPIENFKYLIGVLVVGNVALRMPGSKPGAPPGGGGLIIAFISSAIMSVKGFRS
jgi:hypothetical protein